MVNRIVHFYIEVPEPEKVLDFYQSVFEWKIQRLDNWDSDYWTISTGDEEEPGIDGGLSASQNGKPNTVNTIEVTSVSEYAEKITAAGGKVV
jgi:predicted enzyme related to lactoylglutathione lyase